MVRFENYYEASGMMMALERFAPEFPDAVWAKLLRETAAAGAAGEISHLLPCGDADATGAG